MKHSVWVNYKASPGIIANPFASGIVRKNSMESISSIDRDLSPEEMDMIQKVLLQIMHVDCIYMFTNHAAKVRY